MLNSSRDRLPQLVPAVLEFGSKLRQSLQSFAQMGVWCESLCRTAHRYVQDYEKPLPELAARVAWVAVGGGLPPLLAVATAVSAATPCSVALYGHSKVSRLYVFTSCS